MGLREQQTEFARQAAKLIEQAFTMGFEVTQKANEMIKDHLKDQEELPTIRIFMNPGG